MGVSVLWTRWCILGLLLAVLLPAMVLPAGDVSAQPPVDGQRLYLPIVGLGPSPRFEIEVQGGGDSEAIAVRDNLTYVGIGPRVTVYDHADRGAGSLEWVGQSPVLDEIVRDIAIDPHDARAMVVALGQAGMAVLDLASPEHPRLVTVAPSGMQIDRVTIESGIAFGMRRAPSDEWGQPATESHLLMADLRDLSQPRFSRVESGLDAHRSPFDLELHDGDLILASIWGSLQLDVRSMRPDGRLESVSDHVAVTDSIGGINSVYIDSGVVGVQYSGWVFIGQRRYVGSYMALFSHDGSTGLETTHAGPIALQSCREGGMLAVLPGSPAFVDCQDGLRRLDGWMDPSVTRTRTRWIELRSTAAVLRSEVLHLAARHGGVALLSADEDEANWRVFDHKLGPGRLHALAAVGESAYVAGERIGEYSGLGDVGQQPHGLREIAALDLGSDDGKLVAVGANTLTLWDGPGDSEQTRTLPESPQRQLLVRDGVAYVADSTPSSIPGVGSLRLHRILLDRFDEASALATRYVQPEPALHFIPTGLALDEGWLYLAGMRDLDAGQFASALYRTRVDGFDSGKELQLEELVDLDPYPERRLVIHRGGAYMPSPAGLERVDLEPPFARTSIQLGSTGGATAVLAAGAHLLAATDDGGLHLIDISAYPGVLSMPAGSVPGRPVDLAISAGRLWVATAEAGLFGLVDRSCAASLRASEHCRWVGGEAPSGLLDIETPSMVGSISVVSLPPLDVVRQR